MNRRGLSRNILLLAVCQALGLSGTSLVVLSSGIIGRDLAPTPALATLPAALMVVGTALSTIPASLVMRRIGRRRGFLLSSAIACTGAGIGVLAIAASSFAGLCAAVLLIGINNAFIQQFRFAAIESAPPEAANRALSTVLLGGIAGGFLGPEIARRARDLLDLGPYSGAFAALAGIYLLLALVLSQLTDIRLAQAQVTGSERPVTALLRQPTYRVAILAGMVAYGVMSLLMTATPISMHVMEGHSLGDTGFVIQSHIMAMYLPSLFTGSIFARLSPTRVMGLGILAMLGCAGLAIAGRAVPNYWVALVLLGIGWNFLFTGGTVLLSQSYRPAERFKAQAVNDFSVFGVQALASLSAGTLLYYTSWTTLAALTIPALLVMTAGVLLVERGIRRPGLQAGA